MVNDRTLPSSRALRIAGGIEYGIDSYYWRLVLRRPDSPVCRELYALGGFYLPFLTSFHLDYTACGCAIEVEIIVFRPIASHGIARKLPAEWPARPRPPADSLSRLKSVLLLMSLKHRISWHFFAIYSAYNLYRMSFVSGSVYLYGRSDSMLPRGNFYKVRKRRNETTTQVRVRGCSTFCRHTTFTYLSLWLVLQDTHPTLTMRKNCHAYDV